MNMTKNPSLNSPMKINPGLKQTPLYPGDYIASVTGQPSPMLSAGHSDQISPSPQPHSGGSLYSNSTNAGHVSMVNSMLYSTTPRGMTCHGLDSSTSQGPDSNSSTHSNAKAKAPGSGARDAYEGYPTRERDRHGEHRRDLKI